MASPEESKKRKIDGDTQVSEFGPSGWCKSSLQKMITFLTHQQAMDVLFQACLHHPDVLYSMADAVGKSNSRKIFVRGLGFETTSSELRDAFQVYGDIEEAMVINDKATGKSRGFGFVTFRDVTSCLIALLEPSKKIGTRTTVCQLSGIGANQSQQQQQQQSSQIQSVPSSTPIKGSGYEHNRKVYVGNIPVGCPAEKIAAFFSKFGTIAEGPMGMDKSTKKSKGYALILYDTEEGARKAVEEPNKMLEGHAVYCKLAELRPKPTSHGQVQGHIQGSPAGVDPSGSLMYHVGGQGSNLAPGYSTNGHAVVTGPQSNPQIYSQFPQYMAPGSAVPIGSPVPQYLIGGGSGYQYAAMQPSGQPGSGEGSQRLGPGLLSVPRPVGSNRSPGPQGQGQAQQVSYSQPQIVQGPDGQQILLQPGQYVVTASMAGQSGYPIQQAPGGYQIQGGGNTGAGGVTGYQQS